LKEDKKLWRLFGMNVKKFLYLHPHFEGGRDRLRGRKKVEVEMKKSLEN